LLSQANNINTSVNEFETIKAVTEIAMTLSNLTNTEEVEEEIFAEEIDIAVDIIHTIGRWTECLILYICFWFPTFWTVLQKQ